MAKVLIVDDESQIRELVADIVRRVDPKAEISCAASAAAALILDEQGFDPDLTITDWAMGDPNEGSEVMGLVRNKPIPSKVIVMSGSGVEVEAKRLGADVYLGKPFHVKEMMSAVKQLLAEPS